MSDPLTQQDSPLSIAASVTGILTFLYAVIASVIGYFYLLRSSSPSSIERFYEAFSACALETDLVRRDILGAAKSSDPIAPLSQRKNTLAHSFSAASEETISVDGLEQGDGKSELRNIFDLQNLPPPADNYLLDPDSLGRLYEQVRAVEIELQNQAARVVRNRPTGEDAGILDRLLGRSRWAISARELEESLAKREQLTSRLLVIQMSLMGA